MVRMYKRLRLLSGDVGDLVILSERIYTDLQK